MATGQVNFVSNGGGKVAERFTLLILAGKQPRFWLLPSFHTWYNLTESKDPVAHKGIQGAPRRKPNYLISLSAFLSVTLTVSPVSVFPCWIAVSGHIQEKDDCTTLHLNLLKYFKSMVLGASSIFSKEGSQNTWKGVFQLSGIWMAKANTQGA